MLTSSEQWKMIHGDSIEECAKMPSDWVDFMIFSPPFSQLYIYTDLPQDMGNCESNEEFFEHFNYLIPELYRITTPGRLCAIHCKDLPRYYGSDGAAALVDFPGQIIAAMEKHGWDFHSRVTVWKCPVTERERTNNNGLLHKTVMRDSSQIRQGMADYLLVFRKTPAESMTGPKPIIREAGFSKWIGDPASDPRTTETHPSKYARKGKNGHTSVELWRRYAEPVWWDIDQTDVLNFEMARKHNDEKHICPLQLGLIRRALYLWSEPGDIVFSPFAGIGSEGVVAIEDGRRFVGVELNPGYHWHGCNHLRIATEVATQGSLFDLVSE
jgi:DNA modification methylase